MKKVFQSIRTYTLRGALAVTPLVLTFLVLKILYEMLDRSIIGQLGPILGFEVPGPWIGIVVLVVLLYFVGIITSNVIGRQLFHVIDHISIKIPIVKTVYQVGKQLSSSLSPSEKQSFQKVVLLEFFHAGVWTVGFITGVMKERETEEEIYKVLVPTVPNPLSGYIVFVKASQFIDPKWSVEEGIKVVLSGGIIGPERIR
ncbi:MAG: DUF502 domain-containing protein [Candidatus Omnitrophica bacterium]|nr:DUF502 domain-containing protein [Candidatus Omnitrophota bacterium]